MDEEDFEICNDIQQALTDAVRAFDTNFGKKKWDICTNVKFEVHWVNDDGDTWKKFVFDETADEKKRDTVEEE